MTTPSQRHIVPALSILAALTLAPTLAASEASEEEQAPAVYGRDYRFEILEPEAAEAIVWRECPAEGRDYWCRVQGTGSNSISVTADAATHSRIASAIAKAENVPSSQIFQVILLQAENNGDAGLGKIPAGARRSLEDAREFLPYSGYTMLSTTLLRTDAHAESTVNGPGGNDYHAGISFRRSVTLEDHRLIIRQFSLSRVVGVGEGQEARKEHENILNTSFSMKPGETVIVGTSKLEGAGRALVVLLTAVK